MYVSVDRLFKQIRVTNMMLRCLIRAVKQAKEEVFCLETDVFTDRDGSIRRLPSARQLSVSSC